MYKRNHPEAEKIKLKNVGILVRYDVERVNRAGAEWSENEVGVGGGLFENVPNKPLLRLLRVTPPCPDGIFKPLDRLES